MKKQWTVSNVEKASYLGIIEFQDNQEEWHVFEVLWTEDQERLVFGGACNTGFLESGYLILDDCFSLDEHLQTLQDELEVYYNEGKETTSFIVFNERM